MSEFHPSARPVLEDLRGRFPESRFLALGQTIWWDEPMKAVLRRMLDDMGLGGEMILGVHDTDYFAKLKVRQAGQSRFELAPHNDGTTKDLWSAAGEISRLFGSETVPSRHDFLRHGVPFDRLAKASPDKQEFVNQTTEAWGWRGLVYTGSRDLIVHQLALKEMGQAVEEMLSWGFNGSMEQITDDCCKQEARRLAESLLQRVARFREQNSSAHLTRLYQHLFPDLFALLLGAQPTGVEVACTAHLLRLTPETASLPRFEFVDLFLNEKTRKLAAAAYNHAVAGSEMYTLDKFGLGALPFDLVLPDHGRGTLRVTLRAIHVETPDPIRIRIPKPITTVSELAELLTREFGNHVTLVGKAVALISMLAREFIFVFNEEGSAYVGRTRKMNDYLRSRGVELHMHPILRLRYRTWDALEVGQPTLTLPDHLAATFGAAAVPSAGFAARWRQVVEEQEIVLETLKRTRGPRELLAYLNQRGEPDCATRLEGYQRAKGGLRRLRTRTAAIQSEVDGMYAELARVRQEIRDTERAKGDHFRSTSDWSEAETARREQFDARIAELLAERRGLLERIRVRKSERLELERGPEAAPLRAEVHQVEMEAETARMRLVRNALLTCRGLQHTQHRPSAWWLPMVDPKGHWFRRVVETTELYTELLLTP